MKPIKIVHLGDWNYDEDDEFGPIDLTGLKPDKITKADCDALNILSKVKIGSGG